MAMHTADAGPPTMPPSHYTPPASRQARPRRKSLEQLEAKYKALMRNMLMYQQMRKRNMCREAGAAAGAAGPEAEAGAAVDDEHGTTDDRSQQHPMYQTQQTLPTPSVSPASSTANLEDTGNSRQSQHQHQHQPRSAHDRQPPLPPLRDQQRERHPQKRLQNANSGPKPAYDRNPKARHVRPPGRPIPAAIQFAYEELASIQQQHQAPPQQQQYQESGPGLIQHPTGIQTPPSYLQTQYIPQFHGLHQPLVPHTTSSHLASPYNPHQTLPALTASYPPYDPDTLQPHQHQHQHQQHFDPKGDILDCYVTNMAEI